MSLICYVRLRCVRFSSHLTLKALQRMWGRLGGYGQGLQSAVVCPRKGSHFPFPPFPRLKHKEITPTANVLWRMNSELQRLMQFDVLPLRDVTQINKIVYILFK